MSDIESILKQLAGHSAAPTSQIVADTTTSSALSITPGTSCSWFLDSGCCNHMTSDATMFSSKTGPVKTSIVHMADNSQLHVSHIGDISSPNLSVGQLCELGFGVYFSDRGCVVQDPQTEKIIRTGRKVGHLFELVSLKVPSVAVTRCATLVSPELWHSRLSHVSFSRLRSLISSGVLAHVDINKVDCQPCQLAKFHALPFNKSDSISKAPFDLVHSDVWGPSRNPTMGGSRYFVIIMDDFSRYTWIYLLKNISELQ